MKDKVRIIEDKEILELFFNRDESAIKHSEEKYGRYLSAVAYNILGDVSDAEECISDTLADVWDAIPPARPVSLKAFMITVLRRRAIDRLRGNRTKRNVPSELSVSLQDAEFLVSDGTDAFDELASKELVAVLEEFVRCLPKRRRYIFMSRFYMACPIDEIARRLSLSRSSVNKELARIRRELRQRLESEGYSV